ncbi:MAG: lipoyl synthase, partial [Candidatus Omnitrophica bacterium]|nr:lipoyl synthase [Candidatus Omnitrophota bacterium]
VTRDDLPLGGAPYFAKVISLIRRETQAESIEVLIPDFELKREAIKLVIEAGPDVINHNVETVPSLYSAVRPMADYKRSLEVLRVVKKADKDIYTKSGIMLGLGEKEKEVLRLFNDLREVDCDFLTVGQYLSPSRNHYPVVEYIRPERFDFYKEKALEAGFRYVASSPYVRSSYKARECLEKMKNNT